MKIYDATVKEIIGFLWDHLPESNEETLLHFISTSEKGFVINGSLYSLSELLLLGDDVTCQAESFGLTERFCPPIIEVEGGLNLAEYITGNVREFVSKVYLKVGGMLDPVDVEANRDTPVWLSRFPAGNDRYLCIAGDNKKATITVEPFS
ncbi:hypothetical protein [Cellvibrio sp.]|uniref:hypothetical protein n=1 Tax=Cellvibrio sp. TaxID=1965322 RepID=UPI0039647AF2